MILGPLIGILMSVSGLLSGLNLEDFANAQQISNGSAASLPGSSEWMVVPEGVTTGYSCNVSGPGGADVDTRSIEGLVLFTTSAAGDYTVTCDGSSGTLTVLPATNIDTIIEKAPGAASSMVIGMVVGFLGFVALVIGIIWLVRVNRDRRSATFGGPGGYGGYGGGPYGGQGGYGGPGGFGGQGYTPGPYQGLSLIHI